MPTFEDSELTVDWFEIRGCALPPAEIVTEAIRLYANPGSPDAMDSSEVRDVLDHIDRVIAQAGDHLGDR